MTNDRDRTNEETIGAVIADVITVALAPLRARLAAMEHKTAALEADAAELAARPPTPEYLGVHRADAVYRRGDLVTHDGGLWLALQSETTLAPGRHPEHWKLIVKSGNGTAR
jgi:hypothetical protein